MMVFRKHVSHAMPVRVLLLAFCLAVFALSVLPVQAAQATQQTGAEKTVRAGVYLSAPFVMSDDGTAFRGMLPDMWKTIEERLGFSTSYTVYHSIDALLHAVRDGKEDMALTNLTATYERAAMLDLSYPWYDSGLRIMVHAGDKTGSVLDVLRDTGQLRAYAWLFGILLVMAILFTLLQRRYDPEFPPTWHEGISHSMHDLIWAARSGQLSLPRFGWKGKIVSALWMIFGVALVAYLTSTVTSAMTTVSLTHGINNVFDLNGKRVGVVTDSTGHQHLANLGLSVMPYEEPAAVTKAFQDNKLDAVVMDAPMLEYYAHSNPQAHAKVVGNLFSPEKYVFAFNKHKRDLSASVSKELVRLHQNGVMERLKQFYFGTHH